MDKRKKVILSGYYGFNNSGDDAILKAIVKDIRSADENIDITALSKDPEDTKRTYNVNAIDRFNIFNVISAIKDCDMFISGGGSLLQDVTSTRSLFYYLALIYLAKLFNKPVMVYANGIGPIKKSINKKLTKRILEKVDLITLRDTNSKETIEDLEIKNENIFITADPVYTLEPSSVERIKEIFTLEDIPMDKPLIGISLRSWNNKDNIIKTISGAIEYIKSNYDVNIIIIPMHYPEDLQISTEILSNAKDKCYLLRNKYNVEDIMGIIRELDIIIAMRLHSLIYAATQAVPMVGLVYDPKVDGFMDSIGIKSKCNVKNLELINLCTLLDDVWNNKENIKSNLEKYKVDFKNKAYKNIDLAIKLVYRR